MDRPKIARSQIVFGDIVYWLTITSAIICIIGPVLSFASIGSNVLNPHYLFADMWAGMSPNGIMEKMGGAAATGHYWIHNLATGDGFTMLGMVIGCVVALPAMCVAALIYIVKEKSYIWAFGALWIVMLVVVSVLGIVSIES
jgi:hypothetical protein